MSAYKSEYVKRNVLKHRTFTDWDLAKFYEQTGIVFQEAMTGKMEYIISLSSSAACNDICRRRAMDPESVCFHCYALALAAGRKGLQVILEQNYNILTSEVIPVEVWPVLHCDKCRIESFGDIRNTVQAVNYLHLIIRNNQAGSNTKFAWWTKNPAFIENAFKACNVTKEDLPNLEIVFSVDRLNVADNYAEKVLQRFPFIDRTFTVYSADYALNNNIAINCGDKKCFQCGACYSADGPKHVREILKQEARKYYAKKYNLYITVDLLATAIKAAAGIPKSHVKKAMQEAREKGYIFQDFQTDGVRIIVGIEKYGYSVAYAA